jgi:8-oxo-dGTP diphosphatase
MKFCNFNAMAEKGKYCYDYPRPALTADIVLFGKEKNRLHVLLIERANDPFKGAWAFPGGFMDEDETIEACAARELKEETGLTGISLEQFHVFSEPGRDPRGRTVSVAFIAFIPMDIHQGKAGDDAANVGWFPVDSLPELAFDHDQVMKIALKALEEKSLPG